MKDEIVPDNTKGKETDLEYSVMHNTLEEARDCFNRASKRLLNPPIWHELCGALSARFMLTGEHGDEVSRLAQTHDHIKIDIPGPGNSTGNGYDWVQIEEVQDETNTEAVTEKLAMRVRATANPKNEADTTAHFFQHEATSTFIVSRNGNTVTASYHGRNELPNISTGKVTDNIRNAVVATGAAAGLSEMQWGALMKALLVDEIGG